MAEAEVDAETVVVNGSTETEESGSHTEDTLQVRRRLGVS